MANILIVDDDYTVAEILLSYLRQAGIQGNHVTTAAEFAEFLSAEIPDLLVLDVMLPDGDGVDLCAKVRSKHPEVPIIMLTARTEEPDRIAGLTAGADDYVVKPFSPRELVLRIQSVLRRANQQPADVGSDELLQDGELTLDRGSHQATLGTADLSLTSREFDLLAYLMANPSRAFTRDELLTKVWDWDYGDKTTVTVHVRRLREKIEADPGSPTRLTTVWGVGYRWNPTSPSPKTAMSSPRQPPEQPVSKTTIESPAKTPERS